MNSSYSMFSIRGIDVRVHITFVLILLWASYFWGTTVESASRGIVFGIAATVLLFACVVLHELGHSVQAQAYGIAVKDITLLPIGGVARLEEIPENPKQELRIAIAGPAVNVVIAIILAIVTAITIPEALTSPTSLVDNLDQGTWQALLSYLLFANVWLVLFNLIPAFPMDGGRILRSLLAMRLPYQRATQLAATVAQVMALLLGALGLFTGNFFMIFIAIFVWFGAGQENSYAQNRVVLSGVTVSQAMTAAPVFLAKDDPIQRAIEATLTSAQADFPVVDGHGYVVGMLTFDRILTAIHERTGGSVGDAMRADYPIARTDDDLIEAQTALAESKQRAMPVISANGRLIGLLTNSDIAEAFRILSLQPDVITRQSVSGRSNQI